MSNVPKRVSKWSFDEMESFDTLTNAIRLGEVETGIRYPFDMGQLHSQSPALGGGLLGGGVKLSALSKSPEQLRQERLDALWKEVRAHPTYTRLRHASHFAEVSDAFAKRARKKPAGSFAGPYAELQLLNIVARITTEHTNYPDVSPKFAPLPVRDDALEAAKILVHALDAGVRLNRGPDDAVLRGLLGELVDKLAMDVAEARRKHRSDDASARRWYIDGLIGTLIATFGEAPAPIVAAVATMLGFNMDPTTILRRTREVVARKGKVKASRLRGVDMFDFLPMKKNKSGS